MGRKIKDESEKKKPYTVSRYLSDKEVEEKGGKSVVFEKLNNAIKKVKL